MRDQFTSRLFSVVIALMGLLALAVICYLAIGGREIPEYLAGIAMLVIGALLPSPLDARVGTVSATIQQPPGQPEPVEDVSDQP